MCEFHESTCNGFGDIWRTDNPIYVSSIDVLPSIGHSFHSRSGIRDVVVREKMPYDPVAGRVRGMVVGQGSYKQKTLSVT